MQHHLYVPEDTRFWGPKAPEGTWSDLAVKIEAICGMNGYNVSDSCSDHCKIRIQTGPPSCFVLDKMVGIQCMHSNRSGLYVGKGW